MARTVVAGATGLVGRSLLRALEDEAVYGEAIAIARRAGPFNPRPKVRELVAVDLARLDATQLPRAADWFCSLGTTLRKAGSQDAFRAVDHELVVALARAAADRDARSLHVVSALGADASSRVFYNRVKGEMEREVAAVGVRSATFYRPSLLLGERDEPRAAERAAILLARATAPLWRGPLRKWKPVAADEVACAMLAGAHDAVPGVRVVENEALPALAHSSSRNVTLTGQ